MLQDNHRNKQFDYFAFISYKREDEKWAKWLQKRLESYSLPTSIRKENPKLPNKIRPVFRDQSELSGGNLKAEIEKGLNSSKYLIVICSPRSAKSPWVSKEVQHFIDQGREEYIIPFIIGGSPNATNPEEECFPEGLRQLIGEKEILGININEMGRNAAVIKVIARMFNLRFDSLWQRFEKEKNKKQRLKICIAILLAIVGFLISAVFMQKNIELKQVTQDLIRERDRAEIINTDLFLSRDSIAKQNEIMQSLNKHLIELTDSVISANKILAERNRILSQGILNTKQLFKTIKSRTKDKDLLLLADKTYKSLGGSEALYSDWLLQETENEIFLSTTTTKQDSINKFRKAVNSYESTFSLK